MVDRTSFTYRWMLSSVLLLLVGCGGGGREGLATQSSGGVVRQAAIASTNEELPEALSVVALEKLSEVRVGRTTFEYIFRVAIKNSGLDADGVSVTLESVGSGSTIVDGSVLIPSIVSGTTLVSSDTIKVRHDRTRTFDAASLRWRIQRTGVSTRVAVASSVPAAARRSLSTFLTNDGDATLGQMLRMLPDGPDVGNLAFATNIKGELILAAAVLSPVTEFSPESTAAALARLALGPAGFDFSASQIDNAARSTPSFGALVAALGEGMTNGVSVAENSAATTQLVSVASELAESLESLRPKTAPQASMDRMRTLGLATPRVESVGGPLPFTLESLSVGPATLPVRLSQLEDTRVVVANTLPVYFSIDVEDTNGNRAANPVELPMSRLGFTALFQLGRNTGVERSFAVSGNEYFNLRIRQTVETKAKTWRTLWISALATAIGNKLSRPECSISGVLAPSVEKLISDMVPDEDSVFLFDLLSDTRFIYELATLIPRTCYVSADKLERKLFALAGVWVKAFLKPISAIEFGSLMAEGIIASHYSLFVNEKTFGVCRDVDRRLVNCVKRFDFNPSIAYAGPNSRLYPERDVVPIDTYNNRTGMPAGVTYSLSPSPSVIRALDQFGTSSVPGDATIGIFEPETKADGSVQVKVVNPVLSPSRVTVARVLNPIIQLVDPASGTPLRWATATIWSIDRANEAELVDLESDSFGSRADPDLTKVFRAFSTGRFVVRAKNLFENWSSETEITVVDSLVSEGTLVGQAPWVLRDCPGTYGFNGTWKVSNLPEGSTFSYDLSEILRSSCFDQTIRYLDSFPLTLVPSIDPTEVRMVGSKTYPFPQGGRLILSAEVSIGISGTTGTFKWDHLNTCCNSRGTSVGSAPLVVTE